VPVASILVAPQDLREGINPYPDCLAWNTTAEGWYRPERLKLGLGYSIYFDALTEWRG